MADQLDKSQLCDRYEQLYTGVVADVMDEMGYHSRTLDPDILPLERGMTTAGIAFPAVGVTNDDVDPDVQIRRFLEMLGEAPADSVLAINTNDTSSSHIGELSTIALSNRGCRGVVLEGGVRDTEFILEQEFPVFAQYQTPADSVPRWELIEWGEPTVVGGVHIEPGDVILGDIDGVLVVPQDIAEEVLHAAEADRDTESELRQALRNGADPLVAYEEYETF